MTSRETLRLDADAAGIERAAALLRTGGLVAFPTETVYGLGADAGDDRAVAGIFAAKDRPSFNPLIVHGVDIDMLAPLVRMTAEASALAAAFWPGPLTLVLPLRPGATVSDLVTAGGDALAVRVPAGTVAPRLIAAAGRPLAAPSANPSGRLSPTAADHVLDGLTGRIDAVLDGGPCAVGVESTILDLRAEPILLRAGGLPVEALQDALGRPLAEAGATARPVAPGQLASHYAPAAALRLNARSADPGEAHLGFGEVAGDLSLSPTGDLTEAAANLFAHLRRLDATAARIAVAPIPETGLGRAIADRLRRAAAPRS